MSPGASVAFETLHVQNASEANGRVMKDSKYGLEFGPGKHQAKTRCMLSFANTINLSCRYVFRWISAICLVSINLSSICVLKECFCWYIISIFHEWNSSHATSVADKTADDAKVAFIQPTVRGQEGWNYGIVSINHRFRFKHKSYRIKYKPAFGNRPY